MGKKTSERQARKSKFTVSKNPESNSMHPVWAFDKIDVEGVFAFTPPRVDAKLVLEKLVSYSSMTWQQILQQTHDNSKSKNHPLENLYCLSDKALERIKKKKFSDEDLEKLFSLALNNTVRLIGFREGAIFQIVWYDAEHEFATSKLKHT